MSIISLSLHAMFEGLKSKWMLAFYTNNREAMADLLQEGVDIKPQLQAGVMLLLKLPLMVIKV